MIVSVLVAVVGLLQACQAEDICSLPSNTGPCKAAFPRWFYNTKIGRCSQFIYGGCDGNRNNFRTKEECEEKCDSEKTFEYPCFRALQKALGPSILVRGEPRPVFNNSYLPSCDKDGYFNPKQCDKTKGECWCVNKLGKETLNSRKKGKDVTCDVCSLPVVVGPCLAAFPRWFFNETSSKCERFIYGGCQGNGNNFEREKECQAMCVPRKLHVKKSPTKCQTDRTEAIQSKLVGRFIPRCNPDGSYSLIQCHASTGFCWCSDPDGIKYPGSDVRGKPECGKWLSKVAPANSKCLKERLEATQRHSSGEFIPLCNTDGTYQLIQCHASTADCWCSAPDGTKYPGTELRFKQPNCDKYKKHSRLTKCQKEALGLRLKRDLVGRFIPQCNNDGTYQLIQCHGSTGYCWCSDRDGNKFSDTEVPPGKEINCDKFKNKTAPSKCQQEGLEATKRLVPGKFVPQCNDDGTYQLIQCHSSTGYCWCSDRDGTKFPGTDVPPGKKINCDQYIGKRAPSKCEQEVLEATKSHLIGKFVPQCNDDGTYQLIQCHGSTGYCWCSDRDGTKFPGTDVPPGKEINCDKYKGKAVSEQTKDDNTVMEANYQVKKTQQGKVSASGSSSSSTGIVVVAVCAALCLMGVVGVLLARKRRRGNVLYGKIQENTLTTNGEKRPLVSA